MLEKIKELDQELFLELNGIHNPTMDFIMYWLSDRFIWFPFYGLLLAFIIYKLRWKAVYTVTAIILTIICADQFTTRFMKAYFQRFRPCHEESIQSLVHMVAGCGGSYGFASSHAANTFGLAMITWLIFKDKYPKFSLLFFWAIPVSYSRIYLGVHYPLDIIVGALVGMLIAFLIYKLYKWILLKNYIKLPVKENSAVS